MPENVIAEIVTILSLILGSLFLGWMLRGLYPGRMVRQELEAELREQVEREVLAQLYRAPKAPEPPPPGCNPGVGVKA